jgi:phage repressor protein C with HTH and peptisase S24 domain
MKHGSSQAALGGRIAKARSAAKMTQIVLGEQINASQAAVAGWEIGRNEPSLDMIEKIAVKTRTDPAWLAFGRAQTSALVDGERYVSIAVFDIDAAAGDGAIADDERAIGHKLFEADLIRALTRSPPSRLAVIRVRGDSMQETLFNGDHVLVDLDQRHVAREGIYVINVEQSLQVKRISMHPKTKLLTVSSDNPRYPTYDDLTVDDIAVVGRAIWLGRSIG